MVTCRAANVSADLCLAANHVFVHLDGVEVDVDVLELLEQEEARSHALPPGDRVALASRRPDKLIRNKPHSV